MSQDGQSGRATVDAGRDEQAALADGGEMGGQALEAGRRAEEGEFGRPLRWWTLSLFIPAAVIVDQVTKQIAESQLSIRPAVTVVEGFFTLTYSRNRGAFFSLGEGLPDGLRRGFFVLATLAAMLLIVRLYRRAKGRVLAWALLLLLAGAAGNLVDRALYGEVIDFLHLHYGDAFHWATFNVADIYICLGLVLLVVDVIRPRKQVIESGANEIALADEPDPEES